VVSADKQEAVLHGFNIVVFFSKQGLEVSHINHDKCVDQQNYLNLDTWKVMQPESQEDQGESAPNVEEEVSTLPSVFLFDSVEEHAVLLAFDLIELVLVYPDEVDQLVLVPNEKDRS